MSVGSAFIKVVLVVLNLAIVGIVAMSVYAVAMDDMQVNYDEDDIVFNFTEDELSLYFPFSIKFGGYWDVEDFFYSYRLLDEDNVLLMSGGQGSMRLPSGVVNEINISASMNSSQLFDRLDEDLILNGTNLTLGVSLGAKYFSSIFDLSLSLDLHLPIPPVFEEFGVDNSSLTYVEETETMNFIINHTASEFLHDISLPLAVQVANQTTSLGWGNEEVDFSSPNTSFSIEVNNTKLGQAINSGDMVFLRFGLPVDNESFGPSFTVDLFQLTDYEITNYTYDNVTLSINVGMNAYSAIPGSVQINATVRSGTENFTGIDNLTLGLNGPVNGNLLFEISPLEFEALGPSFELLMIVQLGFGPSFEVIVNQST